MEWRSRLGAGASLNPGFMGRALPQIVPSLLLLGQSLPMLHSSTIRLPNWFAWRGTRSFSTVFDTHKFITGLCLNGFSEEQGDKLASILSNLLTNATNPKSLNTAKETSGNSEEKSNCFVPTDHRLVAVPPLEYTQRLHATNIRLMELKSSLETQSRNDLLEERLATDRVGREITALLQKSRDAASSVRAESSLELGIERGRLRDGLGKARIKFHELKNGIDVEASNAQAALVRLRNDIFYSLIGFFFTSVAAFLGYLRYYG